MCGSKLDGNLLHLSRYIPGSTRGERSSQPRTSTGPLGTMYLDANQKIDVDGNAKDEVASLETMAVAERPCP